MVQPDSTRIASACRDGIIRLWERRRLHAGSRIERTQKGRNDDPIQQGGDTIYSTSYDGTSRIWDAATGECRHTLEQDGPVVDGELSSDGAVFFSGGVDKLEQLLNAKTAQPLFPPLAGHTQNIMQGEFSPDGRLLATTSLDHSTRSLGHGYRRRSLSAAAARRSDDARRIQPRRTPIGHLRRNEYRSPLGCRNRATGHAAAGASRMGTGRGILAGRRSGHRRHAPERQFAFGTPATGQPISPFITHPSGRILQAAYTKDETHFIAARVRRRPVHLRPFRPIRDPTKTSFDWRRRISATDWIASAVSPAISLAEHEAIWKDVKSKNPAEFSVSNQGAVGVASAQMLAAFKENKPLAVLFHFLYAYPAWSVLLSATRPD